MQSTMDEQSTCSNIAAESSYFPELMPLLAWDDVENGLTQAKERSEVELVLTLLAPWPCPSIGGYLC